MSIDVRGLVFVGTRTPAADVMSAFVRDVLGLAARQDGGAACFDLPDGSSLAVQATQEPEPAERTVGFLVDDLDAAVAGLLAAGVETDDVSESGVQRWVHFRAPDGRLYELVEQRERSSLARGRRPGDAAVPTSTKAVPGMGLRSAVTALLRERRQRRRAAAGAHHDVARELRPTAAPTTRDVAIGGQTGSTVA